jgi:UDP-N-acetylmuramyl pentapeptide phosphotransferase/UDP-N-acetylglucosamine-1-phosphate transferase
MDLIIISILIFVVELLYFRLARWLNIIDKPNERSSHTKIILRGGGIIFPLAALFYFFISGFNDIWFILGLILIAAVSFRDDLKPLSAKFRLGVQFLAILLLLYQKQLFHEPLWCIPFILILCAGMINAYNFMDGINGITGGYSLVVVGSLGYVNLCCEQFIDQRLINQFLISLLVFNLFNFRTKAVCFAGDVGAVSAAFILLFLLGSLMIKTRDISWICFLFVYGVDSVLTIIHRILLKEKITKPHRQHLYQLLANELNIPHVVVSGIYMTVQLAIIVGYFIAARTYGKTSLWIYLAMVLILLSLTYILVKRKYFHRHKTG